MEDEELDIINNKSDGTMHPSLQLISDNLYDETMQTPMERTTSGGAATMYGYNTGLGTSKYDEQLSPASQLDFEDFAISLEDYRSKQQSGWTKAGAGLARATTKAGIEIAKMVPVITGLIGGTAGQITDLVTGEDNTDFLETAFNNSWVKALDNLNEDINTELLPVYVKKSVKEGDIWANITSIDFWATEGADGLGYMAAMLAPGALINKFEAGAKIFKGLNKLGAMSSKLDDAVVGLGKLGVTPGSVDVGSAALANTLFEAGAEAKGAGDSYVAKMTPKLEAGLISQEDFDLGKASAMRNTFVSNMAILAGPNLIMSKMLWGKGAKKAAGMLTNAEGELIKELPKKTLKGSIGRVAKDFAGASAREGFFEEGLQSVSENYFVDKAIKGEDTNIFDLIGDLPGAYVDMISSTEGKKAVLLGSMLGGPMDVVMKKMQRNGERKTMKTLLPELHKLDGFYKVFADDIHNEQGEIDPVKFKEKAEALRLSEELSKAYDVAIESGDENAIEAIRAYTSGELVKNFIFNDELGIDALKQYLESSKTIEEVAQKEKKDVETISKSILDRAKKLQQDYNTFKDFAPSLITLENENSTKEDQVRYYDNLASRYITNKNLKYFYEDQLNKTVDQRKNLLSSLGMAEELVTEDETLVKAEKDNFAVKEVNDEIREFEKNLAQLKENDNNFWKKETHQKYFDESVKVREQFDKAQEEETSKKIEDLQSTIENATTEEELDNIKYTGTVADKALKVAVKNKRAEIQTETARQHREKAEEQTATSEKTTAEKELEAQDAEYEVDNITTNLNVGESFSVNMDLITAAKSQLTVDDVGETARILDSNDITDKTVKITLDNGKTVTLSKKMTRPITTNPHQDFNTEGSPNHDLLLPKVNENKETGSDKPFGNGSPVVSYDNDNKKKFSYISDDYIKLEQEPYNKIGVRVNFKVNRNPGKNPTLINALKVYDKLLKEGTLNKVHIEFLINNLPINIVLGDSEAPILTRYKSNGNFNKFDNSSRLLRTRIVNALLAGTAIEDITGSIEGQAAGELQVEPNINNLAIENQIKDLHFAHRVDKSKLTSDIKKRLGFINQQGQLEYLDGRIDPKFRESKGIGELYMNIPKANGDQFPLKLNIQKIQKEDADLLAKLYKLRIRDEAVNKSTTLGEISDTGFKNEVKRVFKSQIELIGKGMKDTTIKDIVDFMIWDLTKNPKTQVRFSGTKVKGERVLIYGDSNIDGAVVKSIEKFDEVAFSEWLQDNKRYNINIKPKKNATTKATISTNNKYLDYLLDSKIVNTNAKVGKDVPTFQGYTGIFLKSNDIKYPTGTVTEVNLDTSPYSVEKDGEGSGTVVIKGKTYLASGTSGRVFESTQTINTNKPIPSTASIAGKVVTDNTLIKDIEERLNTLYAGFAEFTLKIGVKVPVVEKELTIEVEKEAINKKRKEEITAEDVATKKRNPHGNGITYNKLNSINAKYDAEIEKLKNKSQIIRNSQKESLSLHEIPNMVEQSKVKDMEKKDESVDSPKGLTDQLMESVIEKVLDLELMQIGSDVFNEIMNASTNEAKYKGLKTLLDAANMDINDIITKCK